MIDSPLWEHQIKAIRVASAMPNLGLLFEQGTGKTRTMIEILRRKYADAGRIRKTLILCPIIVCENWRAEFAKFSKIPQSAITILGGPGKRRAETLAPIAERGHNQIIITNYETVQMAPVMALLHHWHPEILVCDESQKLKNHESVRAKAVVTLADITQHNYILTGTPILQSPMDLFMQFRILDKGVTFGKNYFAFRGSYFEDKNKDRKGTQGYSADWQLKEGVDWKLHAKVHNMALRALKKDCLDLPPLVRQVVHAEMGADQARAYKEMQRDFVTWMRGQDGTNKAILANMAVVKALRLQQIVTGFANDELGVTQKFDDNPRARVLESLLEDLAPQHKVIVWAVFKENYRTIRSICEKLNLEYREIHGDVTHYQKQTNMYDFRTDPRVRVMIANQGAGGVGVNLVEASYAIYYSKNFSLEHDLQSEARNHRGGSEIHDKVTRIDIVTRGTIDELVCEALANKQNISSKILDWNLGG